MTIAYDVKFHLMASSGGGTRTIRVSVPDTGSETVNISKALVAANDVLENEGIDRWSYESCVKATS